jgi:hypothetical protein
MHTQTVSLISPPTCHHSFRRVNGPNRPSQLPQTTDLRSGSMMTWSFVERVTGIVGNLCNPCF